MGDVTVSRGLYWRDDWLTQVWAAGSGVTASTDGDILSLSGTDATHSLVTGIFSPFSTTTYPIVIIRAKGSGTIQFQGIEIPQTFTLSLNSSNYTTFINTWTPGNTIGTVKFYNQSIAG